MLELLAGFSQGFGTIASAYPLESCFQEILRNDGILGFYKGISSLLLINPPRSAFNISLYTKLKHTLNRETHFAKGFTAGAITGSTLVLLVCPFEIIKCEMQVPNHYKSIRSCGIALYKHSGLQGLFRGFCLTLLRDFIGFGVFFGVYESIKGKIHDNHSQFTWWKWICCGSISGIFCWVSILPIDCVKTRFQLSRHYATYAEVTRDLIRVSGVTGLWAGLSSCVIRAIVANGCGFFCYEFVKEHLPKAVPV